MKGKIDLKDIHLLSNLFAPKVDWICIYDPKNVAHKNLSGKFIHSTSSQDLEAWLLDHPAQSCSLINLSTDIPIELYCIENVVTIFHFNKKKQEDHGTCFAYKRGPRQSLQWIFPVGSLQSVLTGEAIGSQNRSSSPSNRWKRLLIRLGFENVLVDGYFHFFFKTEMGLPMELKKFPHDDYYILAGPVVRSHRLAWVQLLMDKEPIHQLSYRFSISPEREFSTDDMQTLDPRSLLPKEEAPKKGTSISDTIGRPGSAKK
ncbi:MAG: hypothetical protein AAFV95_15100 [Bacteroidota bacterium]